MKAIERKDETNTVIGHNADFPIEYMCDSHGILFRKVIDIPKRTCQTFLAHALVSQDSDIEDALGNMDPGEFDFDYLYPSSGQFVVYHMARGEVFVIYNDGCGYSIWKADRDRALAYTRDYAKYAAFARMRAALCNEELQYDMHDITTNVLVYQMLGR